MEKNTKPGWHRNEIGWSYLCNSKGRVVAHVRKYRSFYTVTVYPWPFKVINSPASPHLLRDAKKIAEAAYKSATEEN